MCTATVSSCIVFCKMEGSYICVNTYMHRSTQVLLQLSGKVCTVVVPPSFSGLKHSEGHLRKTELKDKQLFLGTFHWLGRK